MTVRLMEGLGVAFWCMLKSPNKKRSAKPEETNVGSKRAVEPQWMTLSDTGDTKHSRSVGKAAHRSKYGDAEKVNVRAWLS